jgi:hypothetical protein
MLNYIIKPIEHAIKTHGGHHIMHLAKNGIDKAPVTTLVCTITGTVIATSATIATGGVALVPIACSSLLGAYGGLISGGLLGNLTKK